MPISKEAKKAYDAAYYLTNKTKIVARIREREKRIAAERRATKPPPVSPTPEELAARKERLRKWQMEYRALPHVREKRRQYSMTYNKQRQALHKDEQRASCRDWYARNRLKRLATLAARSPEVKRAIKAIRRIRERNGGANFRAADLKEIIRQQRSKCAYCRLTITDTYHADHIIPLARGGNNSRRNIQLLCQRCNLSKGAKHPLDFAREQGLLL